MNKGTVAIMPPGALGVSLFYHLTAKLERLDGGVFFVALDRSRSAHALRTGHLQIAGPNALRKLPGESLIFASLADAWEKGALPEILIVCPNPDQLLRMISAIVVLIERMCANAPNGEDRLELPAIILSSNGIYFHRVRQMFIEKLEESTLLGRLPDLWPDKMPYIVGHLLRGVTVQTGVRIGSGAAAVYHPGPRNVSFLVGGDGAVRERCIEILNGLGGWFERAGTASPTRLEFEKAIINLIANFLGLLYAFADDGSFRRLTVAQVMAPEHNTDIRELARHVFDIGLAVKAFKADDDFGQLLDDLLARARRLPTHIPSSLQWIDLLIKERRLEVKMTPTETWLIDPLIRYARSAGLRGAVTYFEARRAALLAKLAMAVGKCEEEDEEKDEDAR